jgi:hypothetical protein
MIELSRSVQIIVLQVCWKTYSKWKVTITLFCADVSCGRAIGHVPYLNGSSMVLPQNSMQQRPSWESNRFSHFQESIGLYKPEIHYNMSLVLIQIHILQPHLFKVYFSSAFWYKTSSLNLSSGWSIWDFRGGEINITFFWGIKSCSLPVIQNVSEKLYVFIYSAVNMLLHCLRHLP